MNPFAFAFKRAVRRPFLVGMLVIYVLALVFAGSVGGEMSLPAAGVFDAAKSVESRRIVSWLTANGFVECDSPEAMTELVCKGQLDCGVSIPENLTQLMEQNDLNGRVLWIVSPTSFVPELYRDHVAAALFRECVPYITAPLFEGTAVPQEDVVRAYETMFEKGYAFSFNDVVIDNGLDNGLDSVTANQRSLVIGVSAILLFAITVAFCADIADASFREIICRVGLSKAITATMIPDLIVRMILVGFAGCIGLLLTDTKDQIVPLLIYIVLVAGIGVMLSGLLPNVRTVYTLLCVMVVGSAALCPIYADVALMSPVLAVVRYLFPPYWMWLLPENRLVGAVAAMLAHLGGLTFLVVRYAAIGKCRFHLWGNNCR